ncbi:MAG: hypothetical protein ACK5MW_04435 [Enterococcus sp.]
MTDKWIGISATQFKKYQDWKTPAGYLCGTYASAVLLAYYNDHLDEEMIPRHVRYPNSRRPGALPDILRGYIQPLGLPTLGLQVGHGISQYFASYKLPYRARTTTIGAWQRSTKRIRAGKPVILGLLKVLGSSYGNHWVVAYAYLETASGERFYKIHDNWGEYQKVIPAKWANGTVSLP